MMPGALDQSDNVSCRVAMSDALDHSVTPLEIQYEYMYLEI